LRLIGAFCLANGRCVEQKDIAIPFRLILRLGNCNKRSRMRSLHPRVTTQSRPS
jgi:hypothetical protein